MRHCVLLLVLLMAFLIVFTSRNIIDDLDLNITSNIMLRMLRFSFIFQCFYLITSLYFLDLKYTIFLLIISIGSGNILKGYIFDKTRVKFSNKTKYVYYRDVIDLERYLIMLNYDLGDCSDNLALEHIKLIRWKWDTKTYFCHMCDNLLLNSLAEGFAYIDKLKRDSTFGLDPEESFLDMIRNNNLIRLQDDNISNNIGPENAINSLNDTEKHIIDDYIREYSLQSIFQESSHKNNNNEFDLKYFINNKRKEELEKILNTVDFNGFITYKSISEKFDEKHSFNCFRILTQNFESSLSYQKFYENMRQFNNERDNFILSIENNKNTLKTFKRILNAFEVMFWIIIYSFIFESNRFLRIVAVSTGISAIPVVSNLIESFIFLVYLHPYDVGDRIIIEDDNLIVKNIGFTCTIFEKWNNEYVVIPNRYIKNKVIKNIRRSKSQHWKIEFYISASTPMASIDKIRANLIDFVESDSTFEHLSVNIDEINNCRFLKIMFIIKHSINHQNGFFMWYAQNKFMSKLLEECNKYKISYLPPEIRFES